MSQISNIRFCLPKTARLCGRKSIAFLFAATSNNQSLKKYPFRLVWFFEPPKSATDGLKVVFVVPKRNFKKAVCRNQIRRSIKEIYRLNIHLAGSFGSQKGCRMAIIYTAREILPYQTLETKLIFLFKRLEEVQVDS